VTAPGESQQLPNIGAAVGYDLTDASGVPVTILKLTTGGAEISLRIDARRAPQFIAEVAQGVIAVSQQALAQAGPQLITPPASGQLIIPPGGLNGHRR
jgi:nucleoid-associated protein YgaU